MLYASVYGTEFFRAGTDMVRRAPVRESNSGWERWNFGETPIHKLLEWGADGVQNERRFTASALGDMFRHQLQLSRLRPTSSDLNHLMTNFTRFQYKWRVDPSLITEGQAGAKRLAAANARGAAVEVSLDDAMIHCSLDRNQTDAVGGLWQTSDVFVIEISGRPTAAAYRTAAPAPTTTSTSGGKSKNAGNPQPQPQTRQPPPVRLRYPIDSFDPKPLHDLASAGITFNPYDSTSQSDAYACAAAIHCTEYQLVAVVQQKYLRPEEREHTPTYNYDGEAIDTEPDTDTVTCVLRNTARDGNWYRIGEKGEVTYLPTQIELNAALYQPNDRLLIYQKKQTSDSSQPQPAASAPPK